jgi:hypothetical protein
LMSIACRFMLHVNLTDLHFLLHATHYAISEHEKYELWELARYVFAVECFQFKVLINHKLSEMRYSWRDLFVYFMRRSGKLILR